MGFGLIFLGWANLPLCRILPPTSILGCLLMLKGLTNLAGYNDGFRKAKNTCAVFLGYSVIYSITWCLQLFELFDYSSFPVLQHADIILFFSILTLFSLFLYKGLGEISGQVGFEKGIKREKRGTSLAIVSFAFFLILDVISVITEVPYQGYLFIALLMFIAVWFLYSAMYIYSCYMMIATQEIIDNENKKMKEYDEKNPYRMNINSRLKK